MKYLLATLSLVVSLCCTATSHDTLTVHFGYKEDKLSTEAQNYLQQQKKGGIIAPGYKVSVLGYIDNVGGDAYNKVLSEKRANEVKNYLKQLGLHDKDIVLVKGKGILHPTGGDAADDRKVLIIVKNPANKETDEPKQNIAAELDKVAVNQTLAITNMLFIGGQHELLPESRPALETLLEYLIRHPKVKIAIEGHICCLGPNEGTDRMDSDGSGMLSITRAKMVYDYLIGKGIAKTRLSYEGKGNTSPQMGADGEPIADELNRRVEIRILSK